LTWTWVSQASGRWSPVRAPDWAGRSRAWDDIEAAASSEWFPNDIGRFGRQEEFAAAVVFLASVHAGYISGADTRVDGGTIRSVA
jgi:NAD(P)-dependent dehydrogenase (short-subunit alcohol dehydrogenase family)